MKLEIPAGDFDGYIFDLDGTLIDSMPVHYRAWDQTLRRFGLKEPLDLDLFYKLGGVPTDLVAETLGRHYGLRLDPAEVMAQKEELYVANIAGVALIEPVVAVARKFAPTHPMAIVTGGTPDIAIPSLRAAGLEGLFSLVVTPLDVPTGRGKPAPDMFLLAAQRMGVSPEGCLVFEDAEPGIRAAQAAKMRVVRVDSRR